MAGIDVYAGCAKVHVPRIWALASFYLMKMLTRPSARAWVFFALFLPFAISDVLAAGNPPLAPTNLTGVIVGSVASLSWDVPDDDDSVEGYNVYVDNRYRTTVRTNSIDLAVDEDVLYSFSVVAFDEEPRRFSQASDSLELPLSLIPDDLTIPPSVPRGLTGSIEGNTVSLSWQPSTDDEAVFGYNVYRDNVYVTTVNVPAYSGPTDSEPHSWYVVAIDIRINFSTRSERIVLPDPGPVDTTLPPSIPAGLSGSVETGPLTDTVTVNWLPATDDQAVAGYNIYRNGRYIGTRFATEYIGSIDSGSSHRFAVVSFDFDGNFSTASESLTLPIGTEEVDPGVPPTVPEGLMGETVTSNGDSQVSLTWLPSTSTVRVAGYNIYRNNNYLTTVFTEAFSESVSASQAYRYSVVAFDDFGNFSARSNPLNLLSSANRPPFFSDLDDQVLRVGEPWELVLRPVDVDGGAAGIFVSTLPAGVEFIDNQDGSRSLRWTPLVTDTGVYSVTVTAFDLQDTDLQTEQTISLTVVENGLPQDGAFSLSIEQTAYNLQEGSTQGVDIPITIQRMDSNDAPINLTVEAANAVDSTNITSNFSVDTLDVHESQSILNLRLAIDVLPILAQQRRFIIRASSGLVEENLSVTVAVAPVARDDVYLIVGQSNAVGFSEVGAKDAGVGGFDEPNLRIRQANVARNSQILFNETEDFTDIDLNFSTPVIVTAEDPLHELHNTSRSIVLVPAGWPGTGFCVSPFTAGSWNPQPSANPALGNTLLFDRAVTRVNQALSETGGILRGILWYQGESDSLPACAPLYEDNLVSMVQVLRTVVNEDARGSEARGPQANIPFVAGTMSMGIDERGDFSDFNPHKTMVDTVHRNIPSLIPFSDVVINDDLVPANGFPCGFGSCVHFGASALREMGVRMHAALERAAGN